MGSKSCFALLDCYTKDDPLERANNEILIYQQSRSSTCHSDSQHNWIYPITLSRLHALHALHNILPFSEALSAHSERRFFTQCDTARVVASKWFSCVIRG